MLVVVWAKHWDYWEELPVAVALGLSIGKVWKRSFLFRESYGLQNSISFQPPSPRFHCCLSEEYPPMARHVKNIIMIHYTACLPSCQPKTTGWKIYYWRDVQRLFAINNSQFNPFIISREKAEQWRWMKKCQSLNIFIIDLIFLYLALHFCDSLECINTKMYCEIKSWLYKTLILPRLRDQTLESVPGDLFTCETTGAVQPQSCSPSTTTKVSPEIDGDLLRRNVT